MVKKELLLRRKFKSLYLISLIIHWVTINLSFFGLNIISHKNLWKNKSLKEANIAGTIMSLPREGKVQKVQFCNFKTMILMENSKYFYFSEKLEKNRDKTQRIESFVFTLQNTSQILTIV